jgi:hypothetical protein
MARREGGVVGRGGRGAARPWNGRRQPTPPQGALPRGEIGCDWVWEMAARHPPQPCTSRLTCTRACRCCTRCIPEDDAASTAPCMAATAPARAPSTALRWAARAAPVVTHDGQGPVGGSGQVCVCVRGRRRTDRYARGGHRWLCRPMEPTHIQTHTNSRVAPSVPTSCEEGTSSCEVGGGP